MLRLILFGLFMLIYVPLTVLFFPIKWLLGLIRPELGDRLSYANVRFLCITVRFIAGQVPKLYGLEHLPQDETLLYVGNHRSMFDILLTLPSLPGRPILIAKKELEKIPVLKQYMNSIHCLFLDRDNLKDGMKVILAAIDLARRGRSVFIYPEGTRAKDDDMLPFKEGSFKIATKVGLRIVPIAIKYEGSVTEDHLPILRKTPVSVMFGQPFALSELSDEERKFPGQYARERIQEMLSKLN